MSKLYNIIQMIEDQKEIDKIKMKLLLSCKKQFKLQQDRIAFSQYLNESLISIRKLETEILFLKMFFWCSVPLLILILLIFVLYL